MEDGGCETGCRNVWRWEGWWFGREGGCSGSVRKRGEKRWGVKNGVVQKDDPQVSRYHYHHSARDSSLLCSSLQNPTTYPHLRIKNRNPSPITPALCPVYVAFVWCSSVVGMLRSLWTVYIPCNTERTFCDIACCRFLPWRGAMRTRNAIWPRESRVEQENHGRGWIVYVFDGSSLSRYDEDDPSDSIDESYWYWRTDSFFDQITCDFLFFLFSFWKVITWNCCWKK